MPGTARCVHCRSEILVPDTYAHGDHIKCGACGTQHKVSRGEVLRLVIADAAPMKDMLRENELRVESLEAELRDARASFGIGANGLAVGVIYILYQLGLKEVPMSTALIWQAGTLAVVSGVALELANFFFLAKRQKMTRLAAEIGALRSEGRQLQQKIREASRV
jgi:hypothetical protein